MMAMNISCKQAVDYLSKKEEGKLSVTKRFLLWKHLGVCRLCRLFSTQNKKIAKTFSELPADAAKLSQEEKDKILMQVLKHDA